MFLGSLNNDDGDGNENGKKSNRVRISAAIKFEAAQLYFLSDVFVAVAVVVA